MSNSALSSQAGGLCPCCKLSKTTYETRYWDGTFDTLANAAQNGCLRCSFLASCITCFAPNTNFNNKNRFRAWTWFELCEVTIDGHSLVLDIFIVPGETSSPFQRGSEKPKPILPGKTSSDTTFKTVTNWLNECASNHAGCNLEVPTSDSHSQLPKRIVDVSGGSVRLRDYPTERPLYACLSHCWGPSGDITKTKSTNLEDFRSQVPWNELTATFRDAIDVCRRLKIDLLWIDSLCIVQDSEGDSEWKEESAKMASIYENAYLTIAATKSKDGAGGCYTTTDPEHLAKLVPDTNVHVRQGFPKFPKRWTQNSPEGWPLFERGWVYQEMRLSRRVVHFCSQEVMWECREHRRSESGTNDEEYNRHTSQHKNLKYEAVHYSNLAKEPRKLWYRDVQKYSYMQLTFEKDKFPALAALTQKMEILRHDDRFLAGLWEKTLLFDLLWMVWPRRKTDRSGTWLAPTWSWASIRSQVIWESSVNSVLSFVQVIDIRYVTEGPTHMGGIKEAIITLHAPLLKASIDNGTLCLDAMFYPGEEIDIKNQKIDTSSGHGAWHVSPECKVCIVPIGISRINHKHTGIVLAIREGALHYERIGYVELEHRGNKRLDDYMVPRLLVGGGIRRPSISSDVKEKNMDRVESFLESLPLCKVSII